MAEEILEIKVGDIEIKGSKRMLEFFVNNYSNIAFAMKGTQSIIYTKLQQSVMPPQQVTQVPEPVKKKIVLK